LIVPRPLRSQLVHRAVALFTLLAALLMPFEMLIPDVHDGDASASQLAVGLEAGDVAAAMSGEDGTSGHAPAPETTHTSHLEHCTHGHLISISRTERMPEPQPACEGVEDAFSPRLTSVSLPTPLRPPIA
jgi:hypothetical protein